MWNCAHIPSFLHDKEQCWNLSSSKHALWFFSIILPALCFELKPHEIAIFSLCLGKRDSELAPPCCRNSVFTLENKIPRAVSCESKVFVLHVAELYSILHPTYDSHLNMTSLKCLALAAGNPLGRETSSASFHGGQCSQTSFFSLWAFV